MRLTLHPEKTRITRFRDGFDVLGFTFKSRYRVARRRALEKFKDRVRELTRRQTHHTLQEVIDNLNPVIRGWGNYFRLGHMKGRFETLDQWIRMRLRSMVLKRKTGRSRVDHPSAGALASLYEVATLACRYVDHRYGRNHLTGFRQKLLVSPIPTALPRRLHNIRILRNHPVQHDFCRIKWHPRRRKTKRRCFP